MRINFFGGPGSGKSTTTARVFAELKERKVSVELAQEYVKAWAYQRRPVHSFDQVYLFGKQHQTEYRFLVAGVRNVVTDSPCFLSAYYGRKYGHPEIAAPILALLRAYDREHPCANVFLHRGDKPYLQEGRYQTREEAVEIDTELLAMLREHYGPEGVVEVPYYDRAAVLDAVLARVE